MINKQRRTLLKGLAYSSTISLGSLSGLAIAKSNGQTPDIGADLLLSDTHLLPTQNNQTKTLSLFNHSDTSITISSVDQINLDNQQRFLAIKMDVSEQGSVSLAPGESREFVVAKTYDASPIESRQYHQASNKTLPVTVFDTRAA